MLYGFNSEEVVKAADTLIKDYGMKPLAAYTLVYEKSAEMEEVLTGFQKVIQTMRERILQ